MQTLRTVLLIIFAAAMLGTLADTASEISAEPHLLRSSTFASDQRSPVVSDQLDVYIANKAAIDRVWVAMPGNATLAEAIDQWAKAPEQASSVASPPQTPSATRMVCSGNSCRVASRSYTSTSRVGLFGRRVYVTRDTSRGYSNDRSANDRRFGHRVRAVDRFLFRCR